MNMRELEQDWETDVHEGQLDWSGFAAEQALTPGRRFGLYEESNAADSHLGFAVDSMEFEDDPE